MFNLPIRRSSDFSDPSGGNPTRQDFHAEVEFVALCARNGFKVVSTESERRNAASFFQNELVVPSLSYQSISQPLNYRIRPTHIFRKGRELLLLLDVKDGELEAPCLAELWAGKAPFVFSLGEQTSRAAASAIRLTRRAEGIESHCFHLLDPAFVETERLAIPTGKRSLFRSLFEHIAGVQGFMSPIPEWEVSVPDSKGLFAALGKNERGETVFAHIGSSLYGAPAITTRLVTLLEVNPRIPVPFSVGSAPPDPLRSQMASFLADDLTMKEILAPQSRSDLTITAVEMKKILELGRETVGTYIFVCTHQFGKSALYLNGASGNRFKFESAAFFPARHP